MRIDKIIDLKGFVHCFKAETKEFLNNIKTVRDLTELARARSEGRFLASLDSATKRMDSDISFGDLNPEVKFRLMLGVLWVCKRTASSPDVVLAESLEQSARECAEEFGFSIEGSKWKIKPVSVSAHELDIYKAQQYLRESLNAEDQAAEALTRSAFLHLWFSSEWYLRRVMRACAHLQPNLLLRPDSEWKLVDFISHCTSKKELVSHLVEEELDTIFQGSLEKWVSALTKRLKLPKNESQITDNVLEIAQRRHVLVHHSGRISRSYILKSPMGSSVKHGDTLHLDSGYLLEAANTMESEFLRYAVSLATQVKDFRSASLQHELVWRAHLSLLSGDTSHSLKLCKLVTKIPDNGFWKRWAFLHLLYFEESPSASERQIAAKKAAGNDPLLKCYAAVITPPHKKTLVKRLTKAVEGNFLTRKELALSPLFSSVRDMAEYPSILARAAIDSPLQENVMGSELDELDVDMDTMPEV